MEENEKKLFGLVTKANPKINAETTVALFYEVMNNIGVNRSTRAGVVYIMGLLEHEKISQIDLAEHFGLTSLSVRTEYKRIMRDLADYILALGDLINKRKGEKE